MASLGDFGAQLIAALGGRDNPSSDKFFSAWQRWEGGGTANAATWNPLNLTAPGSGLPTINSVGVVAMPSEQVGVQRTASLLKSGYPALAAAFRTGQVNFGNPAVQGDLNRWLTGKRTPGVTPYVSKIAASFGQGGLAPSSPSAPPAASQTPPLAPLAPAGPPRLNGMKLAGAIQRRFISGGGRINLLDLPGMTSNSWTTPSAPTVQALPATQGQPGNPGHSVSSLGIAKTALTQIGIPYQWGGQAKLGARTDCSGLLQASAAANGIRIGRTTYEQWKQGAPVALDALRAGDAVFFHPGKNGPEHVAIYIGNGKVVEDPHTGASVEISGLAGRGAMGARRYGVV